MNIDTRHFCVALLALGWQGRAIAQQVGQQPTQPPTQPPGAALNAPVQQAGYVDLMGGLAYTDNALLASSRHSSDGIATVGFDTDYRRTGNLSLNLLGALDRVQYLRGSFGGSFYGHFFGSGVLGQPTNLLQWQLSDSFGEEMTNPLASPTPANLQTINDVATGPLVNLHFGLTNRLTLFGNFSRVTFQRSPFDTQTYQGGAQFRHALTGASSLSLGASTAHTRYLESAAVQSFLGGKSSGFDIRQASLSYGAQFVRTSVWLTAGYNTIQYGGGATRHGAPLFEVRLSRQISPFSTVYVGGGQIYTTNGSALGSPGAQIGLQTGGAQNAGYAVPQPFNQRSADAGWLFQRARTSVSLTGTYQEDIFNQTSLTQVSSTGNSNHRDEGVSLSLGRKLRPTLAVQLSANGYWVRYGRLHAQTRRETFRLSFSKRFARTMIWFYIERRHQSGSPGSSSFLASSYNDDRVGLYVTYDLFGTRSHASQQGIGGMLGMPGMSGISGGY